MKKPPKRNTTLCFILFAVLFVAGIFLLPHVTGAVLIFGGASLLAIAIILESR